MMLGKYCKNLRTNQHGLSVRDFCTINRLDQFVWRQFESGKVSPPPLTVLASMLGVVRFSGEWFNLVSIYNSLDL